MKNFKELIDKVKSQGPFTIAVAAADDKEVLGAVKLAMDLGFVNPVLVGDEVKIKEIISELNMDAGKCQIVHDSDAASAAAKAVSIVKSGEAHVLVKGMVNTSVYMRAILNRDNGLRTGRLISLTAVYEMPCYHKLIFGTDSGINTAPNLEQKKDILTNALLAMESMGFQNPKVAVLAANEMVDPKIPATSDAAALVEMAKEGAFPPCIIEGPLSFDIAFDAHAAAHKGIESKVSGDPDLLVFPNIESGNMLGKSWLQFNQAKWAGIVLGASSPVVLGSRSDTPEIKLNSIALGCLAAANQKK